MLDINALRCSSRKPKQLSIEFDFQEQQTPVPVKKRNWGKMLYLSEMDEKSTIAITETDDCFFYLAYDQVVEKRWKIRLFCKKGDETSSGTVFSFEREELEKMGFTDDDYADEYHFWPRTVEKLENYAKWYNERQAKKKEG